MNIVPDWKPDAKFPDRRSLARIEIDGVTSTLVLDDATSRTSGIHYKSIEVHAPYQGRGRQLHLEINGVALTLDWNGGNYPPFPEKPASADYRHEGLSDDQVEWLRHGKPTDEGTTA